MRPGLRTGGIVLTGVVAAALVLATMRGVLRAAVGALSADRVLGQIDFTNNAVNFVDAIGMNAPAGVMIDKTAGHVLVADTQNNRVLGWKSAHAFAAGGAADLVLGQPDFNSSGCNQNAQAPDPTRLCQPIGLAVDVAHNVYVGDTQNNRVLVFADPFAALLTSNQTSDFAAFAVFGQAGSFVTNGSGLSADNLSSPQGLALDASGNLFIADVNNNRALVVFTPIPMTAVKGTPGNYGDATADVAVGQPDLVSGACNQGGGATLASLCMAPFFGVGIAVDGSDDLYVADTHNDRALEYNGPFGFMETNNVSADLVFSGNNLARPSGVAVDSSQNFYVSSETHNQVYEYTAPVPLMTADFLNLMIGPGAQNPNAASLQFPMGLALDALNNLYVADQANNRVLEFIEGNSPATKVASGAGGQIDLAHNAPNFVDKIGQNAAGGIAVDAASDPPHRHLYVADTTNNRVLGWNDISTFVSAQPADIVFGQPDFFSYRCNNGVSGGDLAGLGPDSLCGPERMAVDPKGNLYVADSANNRVLQFAKAGNPPGASDALASRSYGQGEITDFSDTLCADGVGQDPPPSNQGMCNPGGVALDVSGNLFVADSGNSRVLEINAPLLGTQAATRVFGQTGDFATSGCNGGAMAPDSSTLCAPAGLMFDLLGNLWVADVNNDCVLEYEPPFGSDPAAAMVIGQGGTPTVSRPRDVIGELRSTTCSDFEVQRPL